MLRVSPFTSNRADQRRKKTPDSGIAFSDSIKHAQKKAPLIEWRFFYLEQETCMG